MLVYGDAAETRNTRKAIAGLLAGLAECEASDLAGLTRHAALCELFLAAAELAQGLADAEFNALGRDAESPVRQASMGVVMALARALVRSWDDGFAGADPGADAAVQELAALDLPELVRCKRAEGFAFYALYPESYIEAASGIADGRRVETIGIRSIGVGLAALVAARCGGGTPVTVRPVGNPFRRRLALAEGLKAGLLASAGAGLYAVVDEGPGLSGSSFGAVVDVLTEGGVAESDIHLFPSHEGAPGVEAEPNQRERWSRLQRHVVSFDTLFLQADRPERRLECWFEDVVGRALAPLEDLSGGQWRNDLAREDWPPAHVQQERRKYRLRTATGTYLLKFAGLGGDGRRKFERAQVLAAAGFTPSPVAFRHGFLLERWEEGARPFRFELAAEAKVRLLADYLGFRARHLLAPPDSGASAEDLARMLERNAGLALGEEAGALAKRYAALAVQSLQPLRRVFTDNRLQAWEWIETPDGRVLKTDALDHCVSHDLIGCQDVAWDIVGGAVELGLSAEEREELRGRVAAIAEVDVPRLDFFEACYLAFQMGAYHMAAEATVFWPEEQARLAARAAFYRQSLARLLARIL